MKLAVVSDIHDNIWALKAALASLREADALICCGDLCSPFVLGLMAAGFRGKIHVVAGNNEGDWRRITQVAAGHGHVHLYGEFFQDTIGGMRVAANHYPDIALPLADSGRYDLVCYGHNHRFAIEQRGAALAINPGALLGYDPVAGQDIPSTFMVYDTDTRQAAGFQVLTKLVADGTDPGVAPYSPG
jgi:putative phosphoesterase